MLLIIKTRIILNLQETGKKGKIIRNSIIVTSHTFFNLLCRPSFYALLLYAFQKSLAVQAIHTILYLSGAKRREMQRSRR